MKKMDGYVYASNCPIKSHILGLFLIKGCLGVTCYEIEDDAFTTVTRIVNRHIKNGRSGLIACQQALISAGLADFAQI
jgi:hypothetical protein